MTNQDVQQAVDQFLSGSPLKGFIGGEWVAAESGETFTTSDPGSGKPLAEVAAMGESDIDKAVAAADSAFKQSGWAEMAANERGVLLHRLADAVEKNREILAHLESRDAGKVLSQATGDIQNFIDTMRYFVEMSQHIQRRTPLAVAGYDARTVRMPWGPCGFIFPWNFPFLLHKTGQERSPQKEQEGG